MFEQVALLLLAITSLSRGSGLGQEPAGQQPVAHVKNGSYYGVHNPTYSVDYFLGIPYAQPPVGNFRFQVPQALNESWTGYRNATRYSHACIGYGDDTVIAAQNFTSEDCLSLNVYRPVSASSVLLPVAIWIHG